jgi:hypothetical protein
MAANQRRTRQQHAQERAQDYVEAIAALLGAYGKARAADLAKSLGVTTLPSYARSSDCNARDWLQPSLTGRFSSQTVAANWRRRRKPVTKPSSLS